MHKFFKYLKNRVHSNKMPKLPSIQMTKEEKAAYEADVERMMKVKNQGNFLSAVALTLVWGGLSFFSKEDKTSASVASFSEEETSDTKKSYS